MHNDSYQIAMAFRFNCIYVKEVCNDFLFLHANIYGTPEIQSFAIT